MPRTAGRWRRSKSGRAIRARHCSSCTYRCVGAIMSGGSPSGLRLLASPRAFQTTPERYRLRPHLYPQTAHATRASRLSRFEAAFRARIHDLHNRRLTGPSPARFAPKRTETIRVGRAADRSAPCPEVGQISGGACTEMRSLFPPSAVACAAGAGACLLACSRCVLWSCCAAWLLALALAARARAALRDLRLAPLAPRSLFSFA
jgi:hypothetical protein